MLTRNKLVKLYQYTTYICGVSGLLMVALIITGCFYIPITFREGTFAWKGVMYGAILLFTTVAFLATYTSRCDYRMLLDPPEIVYMEGNEVSRVVSGAMYGDCWGTWTLVENCDTYKIDVLRRIIYVTYKTYVIYNEE